MYLIISVFCVVVYKLACLVNGVASFITNKEQLQITEAAFSPCRLNFLITFPFSKKNHMF